MNYQDMKTKDKINEIEKSLNFPVDYIPHKTLCGIKFNSQNDCYDLYCIEKAYPEKEIDLLHELCHAKLREEAHPLFCEVPLELTDKELSPIRVSQDWFADELLYTFFPELQTKRIHSRFKTILKELSRDSKLSDNLLRWSLITAQTKKYKASTVSVSSKYYRVLELTDSFLNINPEIPSLDNLKTLVNSLNHILGFNQLYIENDLWKKRIQ